MKVEIKRKRNDRYYKKQRGLPDRQPSFPKALITIIIFPNQDSEPDSGSFP